MRMSRLYIDTGLSVGDEINFERPQAHYLKNVLRLKSGAAFFLFNGRAPIDYRASLIVDGKSLRARIESELPIVTESALDSHVIQGLSRADHIDWMLQKTTELGVKRVSLFRAERSQGQMQQAQIEKKLQHWRGVAISACEQCGRAILPQIEYQPDIATALQACASAHGLLLDFNGQPLGEAVSSGTTEVAILLGPEGGLSDSEIELATSHGFKSVRLGPRILRTETAATAALALLQSKLGDL